MNAATWTATHVHTATGSGKVYTLGRVDVARAYLLEAGTEGWAYRYRGLNHTEVVGGFRTMAEAKAAAQA